MSLHDPYRYPTVTSLQIQQADPSLEKEKKIIYNHPLYPLLSLLLEQCEQVTSSIDSQTTDTFESDLQSYVKRYELNNKMFFTENKDLDLLIVKAIQVLRIHLNELRKVNELCRDFCTRYVNCLKTKIHQDSVLEDSEESSTEEPDRLIPMMITGPGSVYNSPYSINGGSIARNYIDIHRPRHLMDHVSNMGRSCTSVMTGISVDVDYMNSAHSSPSRPAMCSHERIMNNTYLKSLRSPPSGAYNNLIDSSKQKRGVLPKKSTQIMKQWLFQHLVHPYPTEDEKRQVANQTNLTMLQVNNWFINARRRILQPILESRDSLYIEKSNQAHLKHEKSDSKSESEDTCSALFYTSSRGNRKKKTVSNRPSNNRFWPASLAAAVNILSSHQTTNATSNLPITTCVSEEKTLLKHEVSHNLSTRKRSRSKSSNIDVYNFPKVLSITGESNKSHITKQNAKLLFKDTRSQSDSSTPQYIELNSPNNFKINSLDDDDGLRSDHLCIPSTHLPIISNSLPKPKILHKSDIMSSYLSSTDDLPPTSRFSLNPCTYVSSNHFTNIIIPQATSCLNHPTMFYNSSLQRAAQQNDSNIMSAALFNMHYPNSTSFHIYDAMYSNYENIIDKRQNMSLQTNECIQTSHRFNRHIDDKMLINDNHSK